MGFPFGVRVAGVSRDFGVIWDGGTEKIGEKVGILW
jgi:hypothetical protein